MARNLIDKIIKKDTLSNRQEWLGDIRGKTSHSSAKTAD
jgi:hypothetical protein